MRIGLLGS